MNTPLLTPSSPVTERQTGPREKKKTPPVYAPERVDSGLKPPGTDSTASDQTKIIAAKVDVGWGNTVYLRGEGGCLNWDVGVPMICSGDDRWVWCCKANEAPREFKFLRNDRDWALGENQVMTGAEITVSNPVFPS